MTGIWRPAFCVRGAFERCPRAFELIVLTLAIVVNSAGAGAVMEVLIVGAGVIGTVYGAHLAEAGNHVSVLAHRPRTDEVAELDLRVRDVLDGNHIEAKASVVPDAAGVYGALFKTPFDCEEEKSAGGVVRFAVGTIWAAVVGVEDPPGLEMPEDSFDGRPQSRDDSVASFISLAERAAGGLFSGSGHAAALVAFVSDAAAGAPHDFGNGRLIERGRVMSFPRERIGNVDRVAVKKAHQLGVESGRAVLAAPQFRMVAVGP